MGTYTIRSGDTLGSIAARYHTSVNALAQANHISNPNVIYAGRTLQVPDGFSNTPPPVQNSGSSNSSVSQTYTVKSGDTLGAIASRFGTSVSTLAARNGIRNPNLIYVGQRLLISGTGGPAPSAPPATSGSTYRVRAGDTLSGIASRYGTSVSALASLNNISNPNLIQVGQVLRLPNGGGPAPVSPTTPTTPTGPTTGGISAAQLRSIMPNLSAADANRYLPFLNQAMAEGNINTPKRQAAFLAQLAHESGQLRYFEEIASGAAYEGRSDLGNTQPGDGRRYKGRGPIQLTGRSNYTAASRALGVDLVNHPELAATPEIGFRIAQWFWNSRNLNSYADAGNFDAITYRVNGGYNGKSSRDAYYARAKQVLGA